MPAIANQSLRDLVVEQVPICSLKPYANNPRTHYQETDPANCKVDQDLRLDESGPGRRR